MKFTHTPTRARPRCEIHAYSDASQTSGVAYLRSVNVLGQVHVAFLVGEARVAPLKLLYIPPVELSDAVISVIIVADLLRVAVDKVYYYSDSRVVLGYVANDPRRFHVFVANRVQLIWDMSTPEQWRHLDTA